ncbi:histidine--tRNA ligase [Clostridia bacterium]|nr:histidine--tRNA ligase [Clostridia bacterium]
MKIQAPRGTRDVLPGESRAWRYLEDTLKNHAARFGFKEIRFPAFEHTELFLRGIGDATDVVQKEMYTFEDKGGRSITLRPEGTASVVRAVVEHGLYAAALPLKTFYIAPNFRYEKPAAGRLRQHHQFGAECFGAESPNADVELIALADGYIKRLGLKNVTLTINSIGCPDCRKLYVKRLSAFLESVADGLCGTCRERMSRNPMRVLDCKSPDCQALVKDAPVILDALCEPCRWHFAEVRAGLDNLGIAYEIDPKIVRGLDYYTRTVFEFLTPIEGAPRAICAGGRYDGLVESLGGPKLAGVGFGSGLERLLLVMGEQGLIPADTETCKLYIANLDGASNLAAAKLCSELRGEGINCEHDLCGRGLKAQMKYADKLGAEWVLVLGENELKNNTATLKNMRGGENINVTLDEILVTLSGAKGLS